ncbi:MAG TPA: LysR family transcriptional regulator [Sphingobium sp.]|nr:LysR family transcriptional regulator [Sphingobium sp.]
MAMDLRHMRQFVAVAEERHFGRAARRLNMAQPPLSQAMRRLEQDLGVELFDRTRRVAELTEAGRVFLTEARKTLMQAHLARQMAQRAAAKLVEVRIGFIGPALFRFLPDMLVFHHKQRPEIETRLLEMPSQTQIKAILAGELDVGFLSALTDHVPGIEAMMVEQSGRRIAVPADWELAKQKSVKLADLADYPLILPPQKYAPYYSETLAMFERAGVMPRVTQEATQLNTTLSLVGAGMGCSVVMAHAEHAQPRNVRFLEIQDASPYKPWELTMVWASEHATKVARDFIGSVKQYLVQNPHLVTIEEEGAKRKAARPNA